jgi:PAS domain S-box-containing protein
MARDRKSQASPSSPDPESPAPPNFQFLFESCPALYLVLDPLLRIIAVTEAYAKATMTRRENILGRNIFDVFPDNPQDQSATGERNLKASLNWVIEKKIPDVMAVQKYDIRRPEEEGGGFEQRWWSPINTPVLDSKKNLLYIVHRVEDVTTFIQRQKDNADQLKITDDLRKQAREMEAEVYLRAQEVQVANQQLRDANAALHQQAEHLRELEIERDRFFNLSVDMFCIAGTDGYFKRVNKAFERTLGHTEAELIGAPYLSFIHPEDIESTTALVKDLGTGQIAIHFENRYRCKDGSYRYLSWNATPFTADGITYAVARDITERKRAEERLRFALASSETNLERLDAILSAVSSGLLVTDLDNRIVLLNHVAEKLLDTHAGKSTGLSLDEAIQDRSLRERIRATLSKRETGSKFDFVTTTADSPRPTTLCARTALIRDKLGKTTGTLTVIEDVTHEREVDRLKTEFLSTAAHELRTPLTSIRGFSEILLTREMPAEKSRRFLDTINIQATNLGNIINDLLDLARIESGRGLELRRAATDVVAIVREVLDSFIPRSERHRYVLDAEPPQILAHCDREKMRQAIQNLVSNATKYSPDGGEIRVSIDRKDPFLSCSVIDQGIGMMPDQLSRVFEKFYRANAGTTAVEGTGLGMSIVKAIVEQHGGTISIESELGKGTRATFSLPLGMGSGLMPAVAEKRDRESVATGARILVLEDDPGAGSMIEFYLREAGYSVALASRGAGFLERAATEYPDLICLDAILPDADGFNICKELKADPRTKSIPVIFVSVRDSEKERGLALGALAFITKPYSATALLETIKTVLSKPAGPLWA